MRQRPRQPGRQSRLRGLHARREIVRLLRSARRSTRAPLPRRRRAARLPRCRPRRAPNRRVIAAASPASNSSRPRAVSMTRGPESPRRVPGSSASRSAAQASTDAPPNTSPTPMASTGIARDARALQRGKRRASACSADSPRAGARRPTRAGAPPPRAVRPGADEQLAQRVAVARADAAAQEALVLRGDQHGRRRCALRATTMPSSSRAAMPQRARCGLGARRSELTSTCATLPASASGTRCAPGGASDCSDPIGERLLLGQNPRIFARESIALPAQCHSRRPGWPRPLESRCPDERQPVRAVRESFSRSPRCSRACMLPGGPVVHYDELAAAVGPDGACAARRGLHAGRPRRRRRRRSTGKSSRSTSRACARASSTCPSTSGYRRAELSYFFGDAQPRVIVCGPEVEARSRRCSRARPS